MKRTCRKIQETLAAEGLRGDRGAQEHVSECSSCFDFLESISQLDEGLKNLPAFDAPDIAVEQLLARAEISRDAQAALPETTVGRGGSSWWDRAREIATRPIPVKPFAWSTVAMFVVAVTAFLLIEGPPFPLGPFVTSSAEEGLTYNKATQLVRPEDEAAPASAPPRFADREGIERKVIKKKMVKKTPIPDTTPDESEPQMLEERIQIVATRDVVDLDKTESSTRFSDSFVSDLPVPGRMYQNVLTMAPGVQDADGDGNPNVHGSRSRDFETTVGGVSNVDALTGVPEPPPPGGPLMAGVAEPTLPVLIELSKVGPEYPEPARVARAEGRVVLQLAVLKDGTVGKVEVMQCSRPGLGFEESAIEAVKQWRYEPARQGGKPVDVFLVVNVDFNFGSRSGDDRGEKNGGSGQSAIEREAVEAAQAFLDDRATLEGLRFQRPMGYWANTYVPGDPALRLLQAKLLGHDRSTLQAMGGAPLQLHDVSKRVVQPFDPPQDSALAINLHADRRGLTEDGRLLVQVGLKGTVRQGGRRPAMSLALVLDLRGDVSPATDAGIRAIVDAFNQAREPGDRFHVIVAGRPGAVVVEPEDFRHGFLMVTLDHLLSAGEIVGNKKLGIADSVATAIDTVIASDDSGSPLGSSAVVLVTANPLGKKTGRLADLAHRSAVAGVSLSAIGLGQAVVPAELDRVVLAGQGNRRLLSAPAEAMDLVERELSAVSRVVARAVRLRIRLAPGVRLVDVVGSERLEAKRAQRVREAEKSIDRRLAVDLGIRADRGEDEEGIQIVIPAFHSGDTHFVLLDVVAPGPGPLADVTVRYKDLVYLRNGVGRASLALGNDTRPAGPLERSVLKSLLSLRLSEVLERAGRAVAKGNRAGAAGRLADFESLMTGLLLSIPGLANDSGLRDDINMLAEYRAVLDGGNSTRPDFREHLADSLRYAGRLKVLAQPRSN